MQPPAGGRGRTTVRGNAWRLLLETHRDLVVRLDRELRSGVGLELLYYDVMLHVTEAGGARRMTDLAEAVVVSKSGFTSVVDRMERAGLIERRADPGDRRATRIVLTSEGEARFREAAAYHRDVVHGIFTSLLTEEEAEVFVSVLERVRSALGKGESGQS
jgi:DNA-binding MarR family transcriptional regulator